MQFLVIYNVLGQRVCTLVNFSPNARARTRACSRYKCLRKHITSIDVRRNNGKPGSSL